jgi:rubrerythrin
VALVFTKDVSPEVRMRRMKTIKEASRACWEGRWCTDTGWQPPAAGEKPDGWMDYTDTVPVIATHLHHLRAKGPHGPIWWRFGRSQWQSLTDALTNTRTKADYNARDEQQRTEREQARALEDQQRRDELKALWPWSCPSCSTEVATGMTGEDGYRPEPGGLCPRCEHARRELEHERRMQEGGPAGGIMARLRARAAER